MRSVLAGDDSGGAAKKALGGIMNRITGLLFGGLCVLYPAQSSHLDGYNGQWWSSLTQNEKVQFVSGLSDCFIYDAHGRHAVSPSSLAARKITDYYESHPNRSASSVLAVFHGLGDSAAWASERHGYFDGDYWRMLDNTGRHSFVLGYLACRSVYLHTQMRDIPDVYVAKISTWYRVGSAAPSDEVDPSRASDKIGDILGRLLVP
jgi:hypothetical protein